MTMTMNGKTPAVAIMSDGDVVTMYNDAVPYSVEQMVLKNESSDTSSLFESVSPVLNRRCLMFVRSQASRVVEPVRFVGVSPNSHFNDVTLNPFYEVINPEVKTIDSSDSAFVMFWTNFTEAVTEYDESKVLKFSQNNLDNAFTTGQVVYRALCSTVIQFKKLYVTGGAIATTSGDDPSTLDTAITNTYDIIPIATKPTIIQLYKDDYPIVDFASGSSDSSSAGMRRHSHASSSIYDGGFSFSVLHPGTGVPQKPWEAN